MPQHSIFPKKTMVLRRSVESAPAHHLFKQPQRMVTASRVLVVFLITPICERSGRLGLIADRGGALPSRSSPGRTSNSCRIASLAVVLEYRLHISALGRFEGPEVWAIVLYFASIEQQRVAIIGFFANARGDYRFGVRHKGFGTCQLSEAWP